MEFLAPFHPQIVHTPIALLVFSFVFDLVGRALDSEWWRKASMALLVIGALGAGAAVLSGNEAGEHAEKLQGIPEQAVDDHGDAGKISLWLALGALVTRTLAPSLGAASRAVGAIAFLLHALAVSALAVAAYRGGELVYRHGAGVTLHGELLKHPSAGHDAAAGEAHEHPEAGAEPHPPEQGAKGR